MASCSQGSVATEGVTRVANFDHRGSGFIGSHLARALARRGDEVLILDDLSTGTRDNIEHLLADGSAELVVGSIIDPKRVEECMA